MEKPIETINLHNFLEHLKCFTFFSDTNKLWKNIKFDLDRIEISILPSMKWLPFHLIDKYYFLMHSPSIIPEFLSDINFIPIKYSQKLNMLYGKINYNIEQESACHNIDDGDAIASDCSAICFMKRYKLEYDHKKFNDKYFYLRHTTYLMRKGYIEQVEKTDNNIKRENWNPQEIKKDCISKMQTSMSNFVFCS